MKLMNKTNAEEWWKQIRDIFKISKNSLSNKNDPYKAKQKILGPKEEIITVQVTAEFRKEEENPERKIKVCWAFLKSWKEWDQGQEGGVSMIDNPKVIKTQLLEPIIVTGFWKNKIFSTCD